ncbi:MAG TPA: glycoside hydrolase family 2 TIM barrel-domain containing protein [Candidatus Paceibacterota bacterium]|nr:glycoside hydrolase family 2 TIM barrel-domain containing protein [Verrucomicrobiota bacterium]HSA12314.1 glycoside hydrolase family 2 TIM barrel-domain containing protein [Candidatus Paceibacterota bacterium]
MSATLQGSAADSITNQLLPAIPNGFYLQEYDDCGVEGRQPHVVMKDCYLWTFNTSDTDAGLKERSAVFSYKGIQAVYDRLDPDASYLLALTYASDHVYNRVQSLEANGVILHGPHALPKAEATRVVVKVPRQVTQSGKMTLAWKIHGEVNATVSIIELWANKPAINGLRFGSITGLPGGLQGQVLDAVYDPVVGAQVRIRDDGNANTPTATSGPEGIFGFARKEIERFVFGGALHFTASHDGRTGSGSVSTTNLFFKPVHYRPLPAKTGGLDKNCVLLDGSWALNPGPTTNVRTEPIGGPGWAPFRVPGQWLQQGFDVPQDKPVAVAREFIVPKAWAGNRIILRFDAVHGGTGYWLNGHELGYSENLFTPVEWDITDAARPGETNRVDLEMKVATASEALSVASSYAFHNLGGIDRSVRMFVLPPTHVQELRVDAALDGNYRDGELRLRLVLERGREPEEGLAVFLKLQDSAGKAVEQSLLEANAMGMVHTRKGEVGVAVPDFAGTQVVEVVTRVAAPLQWSAEKPTLYCLTIELRRGGTVLERIERNIGFRNIEVRGRQFYVNGRRVKLAGVCHHEFDPLTGRADTMRHADTDVRLLKEANLNYIRTSHYPPTAELLDAADRLGMYVEVEAPFCWVGGALDSPSNLSATLTPTSAMVDYHHSHPSVIVWSLANESHFNLQFLASTRMVKELDPTRPTTFNHDFANSPSARVTDIANLHYPAMPYDDLLKDDLRPLFLGEYFFPICHEQTDVRINPGLRELWGHGHAEPDSAFSRACALDFDKPPLKPGLKPGGWSYITHSDRVIGGAIWASHDDAFYLSATNHAGYAWHHGFWGLIDYWRRPKPEWWLARHIFSPVWLETRHVAFTPGQKTVRVPVENRYAFTDFSELEFGWSLNRHNGRLNPRLAPGVRGELKFHVPGGTVEGDSLLLRVKAASGRLIHESAVQLGQAKPVPLPGPASGAPCWSDDGSTIVIQGKGYSAVFDRAKGDFDPADPRHNCAARSFPTLHVTRYDFGDLNGPNSPPYAVFPDAKTRRFEGIEAQEEPVGLRLTVDYRYADFSGTTSWLMDKDGRGIVACDYTYSGQAMDTREAGIRILMDAGCDEVKWHRWSEWGVFPSEDISRTEGIARAHRDRKWGEACWNLRPAWPWSLDETDLGTADFRSIKYNIHQAALAAPNGLGLSVHSDRDAHFRAALAPGGVAAHLLWRCPLGQVSLKPNDRLQGEFVVGLGPHR